MRSSSGTGLFFAAAFVLGIAVLISAILLLQYVPQWPKIHLPSTPLELPALGEGMGLPLLLVLLFFGFLFFGLLLLAFFVLLFVCCCGSCRENSLLRLLARLLSRFLPGLGASLRLAASGFELAAGIAHEAVDPLHTAGTKLADVGGSLASIKIPKVDAQTASFWSALREALHHAPIPIDLPANPPNGFPDFKVLSSFSIDPNWAPMGGDQGTGWWITYAGNKTYAAGDGAQELEKDFKKASTGLNAIADTLDTIQG